MRYSQAEKMEIIRLVEGSPLSVKETLAELKVNRSTFYTWYSRYCEHGYDGLANTYHPPKQFWNAIPPWEKQPVVKTALEHPEKLPRELACYIMDRRGYYISELTVYRILKAQDLVTSPLFTVISVHEKFPQPTKADGFHLFQGCVLGDGIICPRFLMITAGLSRHGGCVRVCLQRR